MSSNSGLLDAIVELSHERGLDQDTIIEAIEDAIVGAAYKKYKDYRNIEAVLSKKSGEVELMYFKTVVEQVNDPHNEILLDEVRQYDPEAEPGDEVEFEKPNANRSWKNTKKRLARLFMDRLPVSSGDEWW